MAPIVAFVGRSGSGKTTLVEKLVAELVRRGWRVGTIKHTSRDFEPDTPGKDSYRHRAAGAHVSVLAGKRHIMATAETAHDLSLDEIRDRFIHGVDIVITEGHKTDHHAKIEVWRKDMDQLPSCLQDPYLIATAGDRVHAPKRKVPHYALSDVEGVATFIEANFLPARGPVEQGEFS
jgi:molybdopterin-guanine dinucleotide biosynthesis protein B